MTTRNVGTTYTLTYDAENRLTAVSGTGLSASFAYDGDGNRVKGTVNGVTTAYIGNIFEWSWLDQHDEEVLLCLRGARGDARGLQQSQVAARRPFRLEHDHGEFHRQPPGRIGV